MCAAHIQTFLGHRICFVMIFPDNEGDPSSWVLLQQKAAITALCNGFKGQKPTPANKRKMTCVYVPGGQGRAYDNTTGQKEPSNTQENPLRS
eukprot:6106552-Ditylum_brightwellii.AAC.1